jgi:hypothetical protein
MSSTRDEYQSSEYDDEARALKDSYLALDRLCSLYRNFPEERRALADQVLAEWVLLGDEGVRFDAVAMIKECRITAAIPDLRTLAERLSESAAPGAPYDRKAS